MEFEHVWLVALFKASHGIKESHKKNVIDNGFPDLKKIGDIYNCITSHIPLNHHFIGENILNLNV